MFILRCQTLHIRNGFHALSLGHIPLIIPTQHSVQSNTAYTLFTKPQTMLTTLCGARSQSDGKAAIDPYNDESLCVHRVQPGGVFHVIFMT